MNQLYTFHNTVRGHFHIMNEFPCEDASASFSAEDSRYFIAIVADGHGSKSCFRSDYGSKIATEVAIKCLQQFAETALASEEIESRFYKDMFNNQRYRQMTIKQLTDTIIAEWNDRVLEDYRINPPSREEMGESVEGYENSKNPAHIYGTTLIAALQLPKCLVLIQQGDGRCEVFYSDGSVDQPIPWDTRCEDTTTTSLCDEDVADRIRTIVINLEEKQVMACFLGCDGVEDAYRDTYEGLGGSHVLMGGVHTFYKDLICHLATMKKELFEEYLRTMLPQFSSNGRFSRSGSGDDISVAGIVNISVIRQHLNKYEYDVKCYALEEELFWKEDELRSKTRKHGILQKRVTEARLAFIEAQKKQQSLEKRLYQIKAQHGQLTREVQQAKMNYVNYHNDAQRAYKDNVGKYPSYVNEFNDCFKNIFRIVFQKKEILTDRSEQLFINDNHVKQIEEEQKTEAEKIKTLEEKLAEAQFDFDEYDIKYQKIKTDILGIKKELASLRKE